MQWFAVEVVRRRCLHQFAQVHHSDARRDVLHDGQVVRDEDVGQAEVSLDVLEEIQHLALDADVECGDRFVTHDQFRTQDERPRDPDPLTLATRELVRVASRVLRAETYLLHRLLDKGIPFGAVSNAVHHQSLGNDASHGHARIERSERILEDDLHVPSHRLEGTATQAAHILSSK